MHGHCGSLGSVIAFLQSGRSSMIRFGPDDAYRPVHFFRFLFPRCGNITLAAAVFQGQGRIIGAASAIAHDVHPTPISDATSGALLHFHALAAALDGEVPQGDVAADKLHPLIGAGCAAWLVVAFVRQSLLALLLLIAISAGYLGATVFLLQHAQSFHSRTAGSGRLQSEWSVFAGLRFYPRADRESADAAHPRAVRLKKSC